MEPPSDSPRTLLEVGRGPLDCERRLLEDLLALAPSAAEELARPVLVVVPSRSLAQHLQERLVAAAGRGVAGIQCLTLWGLALEIGRARGGRPPAPIDLFSVFARRHARRQRPLAEVLDGLVDGYRSLLSSVRDLLDAGLEPALVEGLSEALAAEGPAVAGHRATARALALLTVAARTDEELERWGPRRSHVLRAAAADLRAGAPLPVACRALRVYGFSDATGVAADLLEALLTAHGGTVHLDLPPDPIDPAEPDPGSRVFGRRFRERMELVARRPSPEAPAARGHPRPEAFRALGAGSEVREVARRALGLIENGTRPERIGIVARSLSAYASPLRDHLERLGVPYSASGVLAGKGRAGRLAAAWLAVLENGGRVPIDRWLEASRPGLDGCGHADLRTALFSMGLSRLEDVAALDVEDLSEGVRIPVRVGFSPRPESEELVLRRRSVSSAAVRSAADRARRLLSRLVSWSGRDLPLREHAARLGVTLDEDLGWEGRGESDPLRLWLDDLLEALPTELELDLDDLRDLLADHFEPFDREALGGAGGGVQVLEVVEARARTFDHLFVLGCNRGVFPRAVQEDALLPDSLRHVLARTGHGPLPDLAAKREGFDEERFLFAQLLASSARVTLSWLEVDDDHRAMAPSPLVERLRAAPDRASADAASLEAPPLVGDVYADPSGRGPLTALEAATAAGLAGDRDAAEALLPDALAEAGRHAPRGLGRARAAVLAEQAPAGGDPAWRAPGPYLGFVGESGPGDPRQTHRLWVTQLEQLARCPWQMLLGKVLRLEPAPDPLNALPGIEPRMIGSVVHGALERIAGRRAPAPDGDLQGTLPFDAPAPPPWPEPADLQRCLLAAAEAQVRDDGIRIPGFAAAVAAACRETVEWAGRLDWADGRAPEVLETEAEGRAEVTDFSGAPRSVRFRVDRIDRRPEGGRLWTDYKTGRAPVSTAKTASSRRRHLLEGIAKGSLLQAVAYALAGDPERDIGRYLYLHPDLPPDRERREFTLRVGDEEVRSRFDAAVGALLAAWDHGVFFPRLVDPDPDHRTPDACQFCDLKAACVQGDSGARRRQREWSLALRQAPPKDPARLAFLCTWLLPSREVAG